MKTEELRIKNLILVNGIVKPLSLTMMYEGGLDEYCKYIPLTEKWLLNFGFEKKEFKDHRNYTPQLKSIYQLGKKTIAYNDEGDYIFCKISDSIFLSAYSRNIKFVHELQNLYFALVGTELTYENQS